MAYRVKKAAVVFGGHDTWLKAFRPMLAGKIRFVGKEELFNRALIRNAEVVWIQPNAISHKAFYRIAGEARRYRKPIRYFATASAGKCAEQLIGYDKAGEDAHDRGMPGK